jgi:hypothetical protein
MARKPTLKLAGGTDVAETARRVTGRAVFNLDALPKVENILGYRSVWVLATLSKDGTQLRATHYAICLVMGRPPLWGVFTINGKFLRYASGRDMIHEQYPNHVWRRVPARWQFDELDPSSKQAIERKDYLLKHYGAD